MAFDEAIVGRIRTALEGVEGLSERKMFGGVCFMVGGHMAVGLTKDDDLMVRVGPDAHAAALARDHARPMDFTGRPMKGMVFVATEGYESDEALQEWVERGVAFAGTLPAKKKKPPKKTRKK